MEKKYVYLFSEGNSQMKNILGGKGANLAEMTALGLPVPYGFTVSTEACNKYYKDGKKLSSEIKKQIEACLLKIEKASGKKFGNKENPLLLSVRSGAKVSMPGMMDTVLNLGLNDSVANALIGITKNPRFVYDSYRRFIQMFSDVVMGISKDLFENAIDELKKEKNVKLDTDLDQNDLKFLVEKFKKIYKNQTQDNFPESPLTQLILSVEAVFRSWDNKRANLYRRMNDIPYSWGTAVNVQMMVFGNSGENSGTGVAFTRNPATGENKLFGEYLINAQGEDVVAGVRTPLPIETLNDKMPKIYKKFSEIAKTLENHYRDMQDMEFTIENGKLYMLQTRNGKRTATAAIKIAVDLEKEGKISKEEALLRIDPKQLDSLLHPEFLKHSIKNLNPIGKALAASPGAACGKVVFSAADAKVLHDKGEKVVLVRLETSPEDIEGMAAAEGILTVRGGMTSHAAVVARGMGTCCICGCEDIKISEREKYFTLGGKTIREGDFISLNGSTGEIYNQKIETGPPEVSGNFGKIMDWADSFRRMKVLSNSDTPKDTIQAINFGAEGIGLCRTEHMFFDKNRIKSIRKMILAKTRQERAKALDEILPYQQKDFEEMFKVLEGRHITIRLLDPPLHEFLPKNDKDIKELADDLNVTETDLKNTITSLHEFNPMMGHRGCRLDVSYPEICEMQTRAIISAAINVSKNNIKYTTTPEIMIPLIGNLKELKFVKNIIKSTADSIIENSNTKINYKIGTMIEVPRAAIISGEIAREVDFFSFGTNDLTQMTFGFSRDDSEKFLKSYFDNKIYEFDPFERIDEQGVGYLVEMSCKLAKQENPEIELGICGEHGGNPLSIRFFDKIGINYVSCSPYRVPIARLAAAQSSIIKSLKNK